MLVSRIAPMFATKTMLHSKRFATYTGGWEMGEGSQPYLRHKASLKEDLYGDESLGLEREGQRPNWKHLSHLHSPTASVQQQAIH